MFADKARIGRPLPELGLLLRAIYLPDVQARDAWRQWLSCRDIDTATWAEVRLLSTLAQRIKEIDPGSPEQSRLDGIRRFVWTHNQVRLDRSMAVIDILVNANIPVMILKGVARIAGNPSLSAARFVRDVDIMIETTRLDEACELLIANGWRPVNGIMPGLSRAEPFAQILPESPGEPNILNEDIHVDIHRSAIHYGRSGTFDDIFWTRCKEATLRGRPVLVPSCTDQFLQAVVHGTIADVNRPVDWVVDALEAVSDTRFSWELFAEEIQRRRAGAAVAPGLAYLESELGLQVPDYLKAIIRKDLHNPLFRAEVAVYWRTSEDRIPYGGVIRRFAEWARSRHCRYQPTGNRKTLWKGRIVTGKQVNHDRYEWTRMTETVAEYEFNPSPVTRDDSFSIMLELSGATEPDIHFDLLYGGTWFGHLALELKQPCDRRITACFDNMSLPERLVRQKSNARLHVVHVNPAGRVLQTLPFDLAIGLYTNNGLKIQRRTIPFKEVYSTLLSGNQGI